jgi:putative oxidoreductase
MNRFLQWRSALNAHPEGFLCFVRIYLGIGLFAKSIFFMSNTDYFMNLIAEAGSLWFAPVMISHYVILAHFMGGLLLALGLATRFAAVLQVPALIGAVFYVHMPKFFAMEARQNFEFSMLVLFLLCLFTVYGGGRWSLDAKFEEVEKTENDLEPAHV